MIRYLILFCSVALLCLEPRMAFASPPDTLALGDLAGRPDRWPATVTAKADVRSNTGQTVHQGERLPVLSVSDRGVFVQTAAGGQIGLFPEQCDLLEQANLRWAKLTPKQRALDAETVLNDSSLWPETVRLIVPMQISLSTGGTRVLPPGHPCRFFYYENGNVAVMPEGVSELKWFTPDSVDMVGGALDLVEMAVENRPSHLAESLRGLMRGPDGEIQASDTLARSKHFVFFWGANWCGWCHKVSPELAAFVNQRREQLGETTVVMLNGDQQESEMLKYMREKELPWPAIRMRDWTNIPYLGLTHEGGYPQLLITDRFGKILYNGFGGGPENIQDHLAAMNKLTGDSPLARGAASSLSTSSLGASLDDNAPPRSESAPAGEKSDRPSMSQPEAATAAAAAPTVSSPATQPPALLQWSQLARQREAWPAHATINRELRFSDGAVVRAGSPIAIIELEGDQVIASANQGAVTFAVEADATDVLAVANAQWAELSPEQRDLDFATLARRPDLWPYQIKLTVPIELSGAPSLRAGDSVLLLGYESNQLLVRIPKTDIAFNIEAENTDLLMQARSFLSQPHGAPGRLLEELAGKLVDPSTSRPWRLDPAARPKHVVLYMGAGWCPPCKVFAPKLADVLREKAPQPSDATVIYLSGDKTAAEAKRYVEGLGISWPMLPFTDRAQMPAFQSLFGNTIPQLIVADRHGTVLIDSAKIGYDRALSQLSDLL